MRDNEWRGWICSHSERRCGPHWRHHRRRNLPAVFEHECSGRCVRVCGCARSRRVIRCPGTPTRTAERSSLTCHGNPRTQAVLEASAAHLCSARRTYMPTSVAQFETVARGARVRGRDRTVSDGAAPLILLHARMRALPAIEPRGADSDFTALIKASRSGKERWRGAPPLGRRPRTCHRRPRAAVVRHCWRPSVRHR